jgi:chaperonin GroES
MKKTKKIQKKIPQKKVIAKQPDFKIRPLADRVLIKEDTESKEQKTVSGIIIPISAQEEKAGKRGVVVTVGIGKMEDGKLTPVSVKIGDKVLFQWGDKVNVDNEEYYLVRESEILAIIK